MRRRRIALDQGTEISRREDVSTICHRKRHLLERLSIACKMRCPFVELRPHSGMDNELLQRAAAEDVEESLILRDISESQAGLDRDRQRRPCTDILKEALEFLRIAQKPCFFAFCNNRSGRTAHIEVDFTVAKLGQKPCSPDETVGILRQQLRDDKKVVQLPERLQRLLGEGLAQVCRCDEGKTVSVELAEAGGMDLAENMSCYSIPSIGVSENSTGFSFISSRQKQPFPLVSAACASLRESSAQRKRETPTSISLHAIFLSLDLYALCQGAWPFAMLSRPCASQVGIAPPAQFTRPKSAHPALDCIDMRHCGSLGSS